MFEQFLLFNFCATQARSLVCDEYDYVVHHFDARLLKITNMCFADLAILLKHKQSSNEFHFLLLFRVCCCYRY